MTRKQFTLIELLLVITIVALLGVLILPMLGKSKEKAQKAACISHLSQLGVINSLYVDSSGYYPFARTLRNGETVFWCGTEGTDGLSYAGSPLSDHLKNPDILECPSFPLGSLPKKGNVCSYGINAEYVGGDPDLPQTDTDADIPVGSPAKGTQLKHPEKTLLYMDTAVMNGTSLVQGYYFWARYSFLNADEHVKARTHFRHGKFANAVFCDGHVDEKILPDAVLSEQFRLGWPDRKLCER